MYPHAKKHEHLYVHDNAQYTCTFMIMAAAHTHACVGESSVGSSSTANPKQRGSHPTTLPACSGKRTYSISIQQKAEPPQRLRIYVATTVE